MNSYPCHRKDERCMLATVMCGRRNANFNIQGAVHAFHLIDPSAIQSLQLGYGLGSRSIAEFLGAYVALPSLTTLIIPEK